MNVDDEFNPWSRHELVKKGEGWIEFLMQQPTHPYLEYTNGPDIWHLAVTLQSNNPKVNYEVMKDKLRDWNNRINRCLLGAGYRRPSLRDQRWRWVAFYEDDPHDDEKTPHWHIIATGGHGLPNEKAERAMGSERRVRRIGTTRVSLRIRVPSVEHDFKSAWRTVMPGGTAVVRLLTDPDEDEIWARYAAKRLTSRRFTPISDMLLAESRVRTWDQL